MILVDLLVIVVGSANVLSLPVNRRRLTIGILAVLAGLLLAANLLGDTGLVGPIKGAVIATYLVFVIGFPHVLAGISRGEREYDARLRSILRRVQRAHASWDRARERPMGANVAEARAEGINAYVRALHELDGLAPPDRAWADTTGLLRAYLLAAIERAKLAPRDAPDQGLLSNSAFEGMIQELDRAWDQALRIQGSQISQ